MRPPGGRARECGGLVRLRQQSRRCPPSFPCSKRIPRRRLGTKLSLEFAHLLGGLCELALEPAWLPDLKIVAETDKCRRLGNPSMTLQSVAQLHAPLAVDPERLAGTIERQSELLALFADRGIPRDLRFDIHHQRIPAGVDRWTVERRIAINAVEAVATEYRAEGSRNRHAPLGGEPTH